MKKLNQIKMLISEVQSIIEIFWAAGQIDMKRLKNRSDRSSTKETNHLLFECNRRIGQLENNSIEIEKSSYNNLVLIQLQKALRRVLPLSTERISSIEMCVKEILGLKDRLEVLTQSVFKQNFVVRIFDSISEV